MVKLSVSDFLAQYQAKSTRLAYYSGLRDYFRLVYPTLSDGKDQRQEVDRQSLEYLNGKPDVRTDLLRFRDSLDKTAPKTRGLRLLAVTRFLEDNEIPITPVFKKNLFGRGQEAISDEYIPNPQDLARIVEYLPIQGRALVLALSSSGMRVGECLMLRVQDIDFESNPVKVRLRSRTTKSQSKRITFLSTEAVTLLKEWLKYRSQYVERTQRRSKVPRKLDDRVFPFIYANASKMWNLAIEKAGLLKLDVETKRITLRVHCLRKYFRTYGSWTNPDVPEILMGHKGGLRDIYLKYPEEELAKFYLQAEPHLAIGTQTGTILELKQTVQKQQSDMGELVTNMTVQNSRLQNELRETNNKVDGLTALVETILPLASEKIVADLPNSEMVQKISKRLEDEKKTKK